MLRFFTIDLFKKHTVLFFCISLFFLSSHLFADTPKNTALPSEAKLKTRRKIWGFQLGGERYALGSDEDQDITGNAIVINVSYGRINGPYIYHGSLDIITGPYAYNYRDQLSVDFAGNGISLNFLMSSTLQDLRTVEDGHGFSLGLQYIDLYGRSSARFRSAGNPRESSPILTYQIRTTGYFLKPGLFICWLGKARPEGNSPDLLKTSVEGYLLNLAFSLPIHAPFYSKSVERLGPNETETIRDRGRLYGYSIELGMTAFFGI